MAQQTFADALNQLLRGSGISGNRLADRIGVDSSQVSRWRTGDAIPRPENIAKLADTFGVDYDWLFRLVYQLEPTGQLILDPRLAAFLKEVAQGWLAADEPTRETGERVIRAVLPVPSARVRNAHGRHPEDYKNARVLRLTAAPHRATR